MPELLKRITINPKQCGGRPCIRGMRIRVSDVLDLFVAGLSAAEILEEMPDLERDDLKAALASQGIDKKQAEILRTSLATFAEDWNSHEMSIYDDYDTAKAKL
jgi:uncharacterized protein (DUF433 family)